MNYIVRQTQLQAIRGNNCHYGQIKNLDTNKTFSWVYDCGHKDLISKIKNNDKINLIVLSHFDKDHIGGAYECQNAIYHNQKWKDINFKNQCE